MEFLVERVGNRSFERGNAATATMMRREKVKEISEQKILSTEIQRYPWRTHLKWFLAICLRWFFSGADRPNEFSVETEHDVHHRGVAGVDQEHLLQLLQHQGASLAIFLSSNLTLRWQILAQVGAMGWRSVLWSTVSTPIWSLTASSGLKVKQGMNSKMESKWKPPQRPRHQGQLQACLRGCWEAWGGTLDRAFGHGSYLPIVVTVFWHASHISPVFVVVLRSGSCHHLIVIVVVVVAFGHGSYPSYCCGCCCCCLLTC